MSLSNLYRSLCQEQQSRTGLSIRQVASTARLSPGTIDHFLAHGGTPSYDRLLAISDAVRIVRISDQIALQVLGCPGSYYAPGTILEMGRASGREREGNNVTIGVGGVP